MLGIYNNTGKLTVWRNGVKYNTNVKISDGQATVLSLICQPDGKFKIYANGVQVYSGTATSAMTSLVPGVPGGYARHINVDRNNPDGWAAFNRCIGDVLLLRNGNRYEGPVLVSGQKTVLSLVVQPDGQFQVFSNGAQVMNVTDISAMNSFDPLWLGGGTGFWSNINVGRNQPDGWTTYDGLIGDAFLYKIALSTADREQLEGILMTKYNIILRNIQASAGPNGKISPAGSVPVVEGSEITITATPNSNYAVQDILVAFPKDLHPDTPPTK